MQPSWADPQTNMGIWLDSQRKHCWCNWFLWSNKYSLYSVASLLWWKNCFEMWFEEISLTEIPLEITGLNIVYCLLINFSKVLVIFLNWLRNISSSTSDLGKDSTFEQYNLSLGDSLKIYIHMVCAEVFFASKISDTQSQLNMWIQKSFLFEILTHVTCERK